MQDTTVNEKTLDGPGWVGVDRNTPELNDFRQYLEQHNGIAGLEVVSPDEVARAVRVFHRDGFVVVKDALTATQLEFIRSGCDRVIAEIIALDKNRTGNRGSHRYSFGSSSITGQLLHHPEWAMLLDLPTVTPILVEIFGSDDYIVRGGGGDFCLPGAVEYQPLHSDMSDRITHKGRTHGSFLDHRGQLNYRDLPTPFVCCNFLMVDFTKLNGPTRQIPGTQHSRQPIPRRSEEPEWMRLSTVCPAPSGSVLIRDVRAWHGGTPNLSDEVRAIPNAEYYAPWFREPIKRSMPRGIYDTLSNHGKKISQYVVADSQEVIEVGYREDLGSTPPLMQ